MLCRAPSGATSCSGGANTGQQLSWDSEGRLAAWQDGPTSPTTTASYLYDGEGQRVAQKVTTSGTTTTTTYVGRLAEYTTTGGTTSRTDYLYAAGKLVAEAITSGTPSATTLTYLVTNAQGTPLEALDGNGNVTASRLYTPYGASRYSSGAFPTSYGYTGQRTDAVSGLDYYGARSYDPTIGQFTSADTVMDGLNRYGYVGGNPVTRTDPSGHMGAEKERYGGSGGGRGGGLSLAFKVVAGLVVLGELSVIVMGMIIIADRSDLIVINPDGSYGERFSPGDPDYNTWSQGYNDALKDRDAWNARTAPKAIPAATTRSFPDGIGALVAGAAAAAAASSGGAPQPQAGGAGAGTGGGAPGGGGGGVASPAHPGDDGCGCGRPVNSRGDPYPSIIDPRTGQEMPFPEGELHRLEAGQEPVEWNNITRGAYIKEWIDRGYPEPSEGWKPYDIHHLLPREFGGTNDFWNLVPILRTVHNGPAPEGVTAWWNAYCPD